MKQPKHIKGDLLAITKGILVHQVNTLGIMGGGIALQIREKWPALFDQYEAKCKSGSLALGDLDTYEISPELLVVNLAGQQSLGGVATDYAAYEKALPLLKKLARSKKLPVYFPHGIGCGLAGGDWTIMEPLLRKYFPAATFVEYQPLPAFQDPVLVLRTCDKDFKSYGGFQWPKEGHVEAPDFKASASCGAGLHGLLEGEGDWNLLDWSIEAKAMIIQTDRSQLINLSGKVKFRSAIVQKIGSLAGFLCEFLCNAAKINKEVEELKEAVDGAALLGNSQSVSGNDSKLAASGDRSQLAASGNDSKLAASGWNSQLAASGWNSQLAASGNDSKLAASGNDSKLAASGNDSQLAASGWNSKLAASGNDSKLAASGNDSKLAASGDRSKLAASGNDSKLAASGDRSKLAASGWNSKLAASGDRSQLAASGNDSKLAASGKSSIAMAAGLDCIARAGENGTIVLTRWVDSEKRYRVSVAYVGEDGIKADTDYKLNKQGNFVEVK